MTHERFPHGEAHGGPEKDGSLPDAETIPVSDGPDELDPVIRPEDWDD